MFDWIPWLAGILILAWAFFAGFMALRGSAEAGLHEVALAAGDEPSMEPMVAAPAARAMPFRLIQALQFMLAGGVILAGTWLIVQIVT